MVLLPLPLSPASATISRAPMAMLTSSTACRVRRDIAFPILKCLVSRSVRSSGSATLSVTVGLPVCASGVEQAPHQLVLHRIQVGVALPADRHDLGAARREPAAVLPPGQVRRTAGDAGQRDPL